MKGGCECCLRFGDIEPAIHKVSKRYIYVCCHYECLVLHSHLYTRLNWRAQWEAHYKAQETLRQRQQQMRKTFGQGA